MSGPVERWLETFMCKQYAEMFEKYGYKTLSSVCQLDRHSLRSMGVAEEHCDKILENVSVLRQTIVGKANLDQQAGAPTSPPYNSFPGMSGQAPGQQQFFQENQPYGEFPRAQMATQGRSSEFVGPQNPPGGPGEMGMNRMPGHWQQAQPQQPRPQTVPHMTHSPPGQPPTPSMMPQQQPQQPYPPDQYGQYDPHVAQQHPQQQSQYYPQQQQQQQQQTQQYMGQQQSMHHGYDQQPMMNQYPQQYYPPEEQYQYGPQYRGGSSSYSHNYQPTNAMGFSPTYNMASTGQQTHRMQSMRGYGQTQGIGSSPSQLQPGTGTRYQSMAPSPNHSTSPMIPTPGMYQHSNTSGQGGQGMTGGNNTARNSSQFVYPSSPLGQPGSHPSPVPSPATSVRSPVSIHSPNSMPSRSPAPSPITVRSPLSQTVRSPTTLPSPGSSTGSVRSPQSIHQRSPNHPQPISPAPQYRSPPNVPPYPGHPHQHPQVMPGQHEHSQSKGALPKLEEMVAFLGEPSAKEPRTATAKGCDSTDQLDNNEHKIKTKDVKTDKQERLEVSQNQESVSPLQRNNGLDATNLQNEQLGNDKTHKRNIDECDGLVNSGSTKKAKVDVKKKGEGNSTETLPPRGSDEKGDKEQSERNPESKDTQEKTVKEGKISPTNKKKSEKVSPNRTTKSDKSEKVSPNRTSKSDKGKKVSPNRTSRKRDGEDDKKSQEVRHIETIPSHNTATKTANHRDCKDIKKKMKAVHQDETDIVDHDSGLRYQERRVNIVVSGSSLIRDEDGDSYHENHLSCTAPLRKKLKNGKNLLPISVDCALENRHISVSRQTTLIEDEHIVGKVINVNDNNRVIKKRNSGINKTPPKGHSKPLGSCGTEHGCPENDIVDEKKENKTKNSVDMKSPMSSSAPSKDATKQSRNKEDAHNHSKECLDMTYRNSENHHTRVKEENLMESDCSEGSSIDLLCRESDFGSSDSRSQSPNVVPDQKNIQTKPLQREGENEIDKVEVRLPRNKDKKVNSTGNRLKALKKKNTSKIDQSAEDKSENSKSQQSSSKPKSPVASNPMLTPAVRKMQRKQNLENFRNEIKAEESRSVDPENEKEKKKGESRRPCVKDDKKVVNNAVKVMSDVKVDNDNCEHSCQKLESGKNSEKLKSRTLPDSMSNPSIVASSTSEIAGETLPEEKKKKDLIKEECTTPRTSPVPFNPMTTPTVKKYEPHTPSQHDISPGSTQDQSAKKKRGRPRGSKNKIKRIKGEKNKAGKHDHILQEENELLGKLDGRHKKGRKKKLDVTAVRAQGPLVRVSGTRQNPSSCSVINDPAADAMEKILASKKKKKKQLVSTPVSAERPTLLKPTSPPVVSTTNIFTYEGPWRCAFCGKSSFHGALGDLYGPYYPPGYDLPKDDSKTSSETSKMDTESAKQKGRSRTRSKDSESSISSTRSASTEKDSGSLSKRLGRPPKWMQEAEISLSSLTETSSKKGKGKFGRGRGMSKKTSPLPSPTGLSTQKRGKADPNEMWVHGDCAVWSDGVYMVGTSLYGLHDAVKEAKQTTCSSCKHKGASLGCMTKSCEEKYHYLCAVKADCQLQDENFSMLCSTHKNKVVKMKEIG